MDIHRSGNIVGAHLGIALAPTRMVKQVSVVDIIGLVFQIKMDPAGTVFLVEFTQRRKQGRHLHVIVVAGGTNNMGLERNIDSGNNARIPFSLVGLGQGFEVGKMRRIRGGRSAQTLGRHLGLGSSAKEQGQDCQKSGAEMKRGGASAKI